MCKIGRETLPCSAWSPMSRPQIVQPIIRPQRDFVRACQARKGHVLPFSVAAEFMWCSWCLLIVLSSKLGTPQHHMFRLKTTRVTLSWRSFRGRDTLDQHPLLTRTCQFVFGRDRNQLAAYRDAADMPKKGNRANRSTVLAKMLAVRGDGEVRMAIIWGDF